jgi:DNA-binding SARP family transcriptional activator
LAQGDGMQAAQDLAALQHLAEELGNRVLHAQAALLEALIVSDPAQAGAALARGWRFAREMNLRYTLWLLPEDGAQLCARALALDIEARFVAEVARELVLEPPEHAPQAWPWPVRVWTMGRFELEVQGRPVIFSGKVPRRVTGLLKALIAMGGQGVAVEQLVDALWPELEGDAAHQALEAALYRLRRLLGSHAAVQLHEGAVSLDTSRCWTDVRAFEQLCARVLASDPDDLQPSDAIQQALALYRGPLLPLEADVVWSVQARERLRSRLVHLVALESRRLEHEGLYDAALACCLRAVEADPQAEALYQAAMRRHLDAGRCNEARAVYQRLCQALAAAGQQPSLESVALGRSSEAGT